MRKKKLPKSIRKYIRQEKARLRREILDLEEQKKQIEKLYERQGVRGLAKKQIKEYIRNNERQETS